VRGAQAAPDPGLGNERRESPTIQFFSGADRRSEERTSRLLAQIEQSQRTLEHSRQIIARIDEVLANTDKK
jgi:hypothetical protein